MVYFSNWLSKRDDLTLPLHINVLLFNSIHLWVTYFEGEGLKPPRQGLRARTLRGLLNKSQTTTSWRQARVGQQYNNQLIERERRRISCLRRNHQLLQQVCIWVSRCRWRHDGPRPPWLIVSDYRHTGSRLYEIPRIPLLAVSRSVAICLCTFSTSLWSSNKC